MTRLPLALSMGDPAGVGPELVAAAWAARQAESLLPFMVFGNAAVLTAAARTRGLDISTHAIHSPGQVAEVFGDALPVAEQPCPRFAPGEPAPGGALAALASLQVATKHTIGGFASALVTAPVGKAALAEVGFAFPGQTEFLAARCGLAADDVVMMLAGPNLRTVPLTIHCALSEVPRRLTQDLIVDRATVTANALERDFGIATPCLAITGLNPHAGEGGAFGDEETRIIAPAIATLRRQGIDATGPHAADALFTPHARGGYDVALCMYHDQALIPIKALDFDAGVNVTLGLPIVRTSPDHGTALDIAGRNIADPGAMIAAIRMAGEMAARRAG